MESQEWEGKQLDKDIVIPGNKVYSPDACIFVDKRINNLMTSRNSRALPIGIHFRASRSVFYVSCNEVSIFRKSISDCRL